MWLEFFLTLSKNVSITIMETSKAKLCLEVLAILHIIVGLILPFLVDTWLFEYYNNKLLDTFHTNSTEALALAKFMISLLGPTIASWGVLFLFLVRYAYKCGSTKAWYVMLIAIIGWSFYDIFLSLIVGVYLNVVIDIVVLGLLLTPLLLSRNHFVNNSP
ncbi:MAG: hypothetical protein ACI9XC_001218 [Gammaproteobacteria bacterium]|jgi:hypothetical protein